MNTKMSALSLRLPQSGSDTLVDSVPLLYDPAHMFFLDTFSWTHFLKIRIPLHDAQRGNGAQLPWRGAGDQGLGEKHEGLRSEEKEGPQLDALRRTQAE